MANAEHVAIVKQGGLALAEWRLQHPGLRLDLSHANLDHADLKGYWDTENPSDLHHFDLSECDFSGCSLKEATILGGNLSRANLDGANLLMADLRSADLRHATLVGAELVGTNLGSANLAEANLKRASCYATVFGNLDLSTVVGLETVRHLGPSIVDVATLYSSQGKIPESFLRECGVPAGLITYLPALIGAEVGYLFYSCFISYSHKDEAFTKTLYARMQKEHLRVWYAPEDIKSGQKIHEQIDRAIGVFDKLLLILSENSMGSEWVKTEIYKARQREIKEGRRILFPIRLVDFETIRRWECFDADTGKDLAREIREYFIPDFANWRQQADFEAGFDRLLKDLRAEAASEAKKA